MTNVLLFFPSPPLIPPIHTPVSTFSVVEWQSGHPVPFVALSTLVTSFEFCVQPQSQLLTASFVVLQFWSVSHWGVPHNAARLPVLMSIFFYGYWNSRSLARKHKWHHSPGIKISGSKYFMCEEFTCCQLFPKMI